MSDLVVFGIPGAAIIVALIELAKRYGMDTKWAPLLAVVLGVALAVIVQLSALNPQVAIWAQLILGGILTGLASVGVYSGVKNTVERFGGK